MLTKTDSGRRLSPILILPTGFFGRLLSFGSFMATNWFKVLTPFGWFAVCAIVMGAAVALAT
jgi:hypothetical protein